VRGGRGCGGLAAALLGAKAVTLTDQASALAPLRRRAEDAAPRGADVRVAEIDWRAGVPDSVAPDGVDVVLASDTVWLEALVAPFADCVSSLLSRPGNATLFLAHQTRSTRVDDLLFAAFDARGLRHERIPTEDLHADYRPPHVALFRVTVRA